MLSVRVFDILKRTGIMTAPQIAHALGISRQAAHKHLVRLLEEGSVIRCGKTRNAEYACATDNNKNYFLRKGIAYHTVILLERKPEEDIILQHIKSSQELLFWKLPKNVVAIIDFAFTEMLNNAIEHSRGTKISLLLSRDTSDFRFEIRDDGIGVFNSVMKKFRLVDQKTAALHILKGKTTTKPKHHSGEGIFFTSKLADHFRLASEYVVAILEKGMAEINTVRKRVVLRGTVVDFEVSLNTKRSTKEVFDQYTDEEYEFSKTMVSISLYAGNVNFVSRSQARRLLTGLEKFKTVTLDFKGIDSIGQGFADEVFRVFRKSHPEVTIEPINTSEHVQFMIERARAKD